MDDEQVMHGMGIDDTYRVERVLSSRRGYVTEVVTLDGAGPFIRKKIPLDQANRAVWASLGTCACPMLPQVVATYELPDAFVVVCAYVPGETLETRLQQRGRFDEAQATRIALDVCEAASSLHAHGIIHCDITPANIVLAADGAHLIDMGIARMASDPVPPGGGRMGTLGYASPEQCFAAADARSDVYAIGRVLAAMLTGVHPDEEEFEQRLGDASIVRPEVRELIERATAFEPSARFADVDELACALRTVRGEKASAPRTAARTGEKADVPAPSRSRVVRIALVCCAVAGAVAIGAVAAGAALHLADGSASVSDSADASTVVDSDTPDGDSTSITTILDELTPDDADKDDAAQDADVQEAREALSITDSWWDVDSGGYLVFAFGLTDASADLTIEYPIVRVVGRDAAGEVVLTHEQVCSVAGPGQTLYFAGYADAADQVESVSFDIVTPLDFTVRRGSGDQSTFEVVSLHTSDSMFGMVATGEMRAERIGSDAEIAMGCAVTVILRDATGAIVWAETGSTELPQEGETVPFEVQLHERRDFATAEAHICLW